MRRSAKLLRIYTDESSFVGDRPISEYISSLAREHHLAGVTVVEALVGYGQSAHVHRAHLFESDRALVIEIVEEEEKLRRFVAALSDVSDISLMTLETVEILGGNAAPEPPESPP